MKKNWFYWSLTEPQKMDRMTRFSEDPMGREAARDRADGMIDAVETLTDRQRQLLKMRFLEGMKYSQIGKELRISKQGARHMILAALLKMQRKMDN